MWPIDRERITQYLKEMVAIDSVNPGLIDGAVGEADMAAWLAQTCESLGLEVETDDTAPNRPNIIARWRGTGVGQSILLTGHTDVVGTEGMEIAPFEPTIADGKLYGRGAYDMKGGLASILGCVMALQANNFQPKGDIILGFVTDEEYISIGTEHMLKSVQADACILTEPSDRVVCIAHRGFAWLTITVDGHAAHGSQYEKGVDAIRYMGYVLELMRFMEESVFPSHEHPFLGRASVHGSLIEGGLGLSTYPDQCTLKIEHRLLPDEKPADILKLWQGSLAQISQDVPDFKATVSLDFARNGWEESPDSPIVQTMGQAYEKITGEKPLYEGMFGWLDSALIAEAGIPTVIFGARGAGAHAAVEYVQLEDVFICAEVMAEAVADWCG